MGNASLSTKISTPHRTPFFCLESKDLVLELADRTGLGEAKTLGSLLQTTNHRRGATEQDLDIAGGLGEPLLKELSAPTLVS